MLNLMEHFPLSDYGHNSARGLHAMIEAKKLADQWFSDNRDRIKQLPHDRQDAYRQIVALSTDPQDVDLARPMSRLRRR